MAEWAIEPLQSKHQRAEFFSGNDQLDSFLRTLVSQYENRHLGRTIVATPSASNQVAGFYTLAAGSLTIDCLPATIRKKMPRHPVPIVHLGRLAVDRTFHLYLPLKTIERMFAKKNS